MGSSSDLTVVGQHKSWLLGCLFGAASAAQLCSAAAEVLCGHFLEPSSLLCTMLPVLLAYVCLSGSCGYICLHCSCVLSCSAQLESIITLGDFFQFSVLFFFVDHG